MKTADLKGAALDWAVATAEGYKKWDGECFAEYADGYPGAFFIADWNPSSNWAHGGPIIEREKMKVFPNVGGNWTAQITHTESHPLVAHPVIAGWSRGSGQTPLIAAMRCYVASKLGDDVNVPEELQ